MAKFSQQTFREGSNIFNYDPNTRVSTKLEGSDLQGALSKAGNDLSRIQSGQPDFGSPIVSSEGARNENNALSDDLKRQQEAAGLQAASDAETKRIEDRMDQLDQQRKSQIEQIQKDFDVAQEAQGGRQEKAFAGRATGLITSGGGFLGATQSQEGVLQSLRNDHESEKTALIGKKNAAIQAAQNAFDEKDFALAGKLAKEAKDTEQEIFARQKDFNTQQLALSREARSQKEFDLGITEKKIEAFTQLNDVEFGKITDEEIAEADQFYFPGYTAAKRKIAKDIAAGKTLENDLKFKSSLQSLINKTPIGTKITLADGTQYVGLKKASSTGGSTRGLITPTLANQLQVPSLAGKDESEVILSLSLNNPPQWFRETLKIPGPVKFTEKDVKTEWDAFREDPDIDAYRNSAVVTKRIEGANSGVNITLDEDAIAAAFDNL